MANAEPRTEGPPQDARWWRGGEKRMPVPPTGGV